MNLEIFKYEEKDVRTQLIENEVWFVGKDIADILGYTNQHKAIRDHIDNEDKRTEQIVHPLGGSQNTILINESGLYSLILSSKLENAKKFKKWVTSEVLPSIRKTGQYKVKQIEIDKEERARKRLEIMEKNARVRESKQFSKLAEMTKDLRYKETLIAISTNTLANEKILPLPRLEQETYTAGEIGKILGISANLVGRIANEHGIKSDRFGYLAQDKAKYANKSVESFRYYAHAIDEFRKYL